MHFQELNGKIDQAKEEIEKMFNVSFILLIKII